MNCQSISDRRIILDLCFCFFFVSIILEYPAILPVYFNERLTRVFTKEQCLPMISKQLVLQPIINYCNVSIFCNKQISTIFRIKYQNTLCHLFAIEEDSKFKLTLKCANRVTPNIKLHPSRSSYLILQFFKKEEKAQNE